jgi:hypothetical protein
LKLQPRRKLFLGGVAILLAIGFVFSWLVGSALMAPARRAVTLPPAFAGAEDTFHSDSGATLRGNFLQASGAGELSS